MKNDVESFCLLQVPGHVYSFKNRNDIFEVLTVICNVSMMGAIYTVFNGWSWETAPSKPGLLDFYCII